MISITTWDGGVADGFFLLENLLCVTKNWALKTWDEVKRGLFVIESLPPDGWDILGSAQKPSGQPLNLAKLHARP
jgi:hypothetical protein